MSYSQALEEQVRLLRSTTKGSAGAVMRGIAYGDDTSPYSEAVRSLRVNPLTLPRTQWEETTTAGLALAVPYFWAASLCTLVETVARDMPPWTLTAAALPSPDGFFWFAQPLAIPPYAGTWLHALVWTAVTRADDGSTFKVMTGPGVGGDGIAMTTWATVEGASDGLRPYLPYHNLDWWYGESFETASARYQPEMVERKRYVLRLIASMFAFLNQRILVHSEQSVERHARRRLERQGWQHEPLVRVVELRRRQSTAAPSGEHQAVDWSCRWVVSGHWRSQYYPSVDEHRPLWILPYVKGPDSKPLRPPRAKVFAVVR